MKRKHDGIRRLTALALAALLLMMAAGTALAETISAIVSSNTATVYGDAGLSQRLATLNSKTVVRVSSYADGVAKISYNGYTGYVSASDLKAVDDVAQKAVLNADAKVYKSPSAKSKSVTVKKGTRLYVLLVKDEWAMVEKDGVVGYVGASFLTKADDNWNVAATAAPEITAAPTPAPTATPPLDEAVSATVIVNALPVYSAASTSASLVGTLAQGQQVNVLKWNSAWALLELNGKYGYAAVKGLIKTSELSKLTPEPTATPTPAPTAVPSTDQSIKATVIVDALDAYAEASIAAEVIGTLKKGQEVNALQWNGTWALVELNGRYGYCAVQGLIRSSELAIAAPTATPTAVPTPAPTATATPAPTATPSLADAQKATVTVSYLAAYKLPSTASERLGILRQGQEVNVLRYNSSWAQIELNGKYGYCPVKGLTRTSDLPVATATPAPTATPDLSSAVPATVTVDSLAAYSAPSASATLLGTLTRGQQVNVLAWKDSWAMIELNGKYGYCAVLGLTRNSDLAVATPTPTPAPTAMPSLTNAQKATVTVSSLPAYRSASTSASIVGTLTKGQVVNVIEYNATWAHIELNGKYGYCAVAGLVKGETLPSATPTPDLSSAVAAQVSDSSVAVYRMASAGSAKLGTLYQGREVNVLSVSDGWALIELNGYYGFCQASALTKKLPTGYSAGGFTATVIYPGAKAYASANTGAASLSLALGSSVSVYAYNSAWAVLEKGGSYAFIPVSHLSRTNYDSVGGSGAALQTLLKALLSLGYYDGNPSTTYDAAATTAIKRFQAACGLSETGVADEVTQRILFGGYAPKDALLSASLSKGSTGTSVTRMQTRLFALGYLSKSGSLDGDYGNNTTSAVKLFQSANGITASGTADAATLGAMYSTGAKSLPSGSKAADATTTTTSNGGSTTYSDTIPAGLVSTVSTYSASMSTAEKLEYIVYLAQSKLGKPYVYGASGPDKFDCSGLTYYVYKQIGITLKRSAYSQGYDSTYQMIENISDLQRGDLVYFNTISDSDLSDHTGVYIGNGYFIHAPHTGTNVSVSYLYSGYYSRAFSWGRRILT